MVATPIDFLAAYGATVLRSLLDAAAKATGNTKIPVIVDAIIAAAAGGAAAYGYYTGRMSEATQESLAVIAAVSAGRLTNYAIERAAVQAAKLAVSVPPTPASTGSSRTVILSPRQRGYVKPVRTAQVVSTTTSGAAKAASVIV